MPYCPKCQQLVPEQALTCSRCRTVLKAYGHPGMTLHQAKDDRYLCQTCVYHQDDSCNYPQRPYAQSCIMYTSAEAQAREKIAMQTQWNWRLFYRRHQGVVWLVALLLISIAITLLSWKK